MVVLHGLRAAIGKAPDRSSERTDALDGLRPLVGPLPEPVSRISGPRSLLDETGDGLPEGRAKAEAIAIRLRRAGVPLSWGEPDVIDEDRAFVEAFRARGASSVEVVRADPSLATELRLGAYFNAYWPARVLRRLLRAAPDRALGSVPVHLAADAAFWRGVREAATDREWERLTRSSYVVLTYHRIAGERVPGQERLDVDPAMFRRQLRWLRRFRFQPLSSEQLARFHADPAATLPRRSFVVTADDAFRDAVTVMGRELWVKPQLFVNTGLAGAVAPWADGRPIATWEELRTLGASGAAIGSHARSHGRLPESDRLDEELAGSLRELRAHVPSAIPVLAYPHGSHDERVRAAAAAAGYRAAFTTETGRNGACTDRFCLRRVGVKDWDGPLSILWKAVTGEVVPPEWDRLARSVRRLRLRRVSRRRPATG